MHRIPIQFRLRQSAYTRYIRTLTRHRSLYNAELAPAPTRIHEKDARLISGQEAGGGTRQHNLQQETAQWPPKSELPFPLGIRLRGSKTDTPSGQKSDLDAIYFWECHILSSRQDRGDQGTWETLLELRDRDQSHLLTKTGASFLRDNILEAALTNSDRMEELFKVAGQLLETHDFNWPELYVKVVHFYLAHADYENALAWHFKLMPLFRPELGSFGALLASCAIDFTPKLQSTLTKIYVFSPYRELYDYVVPALFESGQSHAARVWRKRFNLFNDHPKSPKSMPFLDFFSRYFSAIQLTKEELAVLNGDTSIGDGVRTNVQKDTQLETNSSFFSDRFTARWFASSWTSPEFAINLMHKIGLRTISYHSLQSIALREDDARGVADRLIQLRKLGIGIRSGAYCDAIISFAERGEDELLRTLLHCDIHPEEFGNPETRSILLASSAQKQDWGLERLLQEVEGVAATPGPSKDSIIYKDLNKHLSMALSMKRFAKVRNVVDKMESLDVSMERENSKALLNHVFEDIGYHPKLNRPQLLDRAIHLSLRVARHGVAVPVRYWQILLYNLGRLGRFNDLEGLSYGICEIYRPEPGGLIPVHRQDQPPNPNIKAEELDSESGTWSEYYSFADGKKKRSHFKEEFWRAEIGPCQNETNPKQKHHRRSKNRNDLNHELRIPADLPFTNRQHPIQKIFDASLQRSIIRWGFDQTLAQRPIPPSLVNVKPAGIADFDLACGVRLLAVLRDKGVYVDPQIVRSTVIYRLAVAQLPMRPRARERDDRELSPANMKQLVEGAWGSQILPSEAQLASEIEKQKPKLWKSYPRLFEKSYDNDDRISSEPHASRTKEKVWF
ncbi:pentatricopeptide repeat domain-containing protein [Fusarium coicis]|nr:pentatricopeptide repeat domain-containing protein [Fusarium coicis]